MRRKQIIDVTGTPLTPSRQGKKCLGNGEHPEYEICCDECNYYLYCYPQFAPKIKKTWLKNCLTNCILGGKMVKPHIVGLLKLR